MSFKDLNIDNDLIKKITDDICSEIDKEILTRAMLLTFDNLLLYKLQSNWPEKKFSIEKTQLPEKLKPYYTIIIDNTYSIAVEDCFLSSNDEQRIDDIVGIVGEYIYDINNANRRFL